MSDSDCRERILDDAFLLFCAKKKKQEKGTPTVLALRATLRFSPLAETLTNSASPQTVIALIRHRLRFSAGQKGKLKAEKSTVIRDEPYFFGSLRIV